MVVLGVVLAGGSWLVSAAIASVHTADVSFAELLKGAGPSHSLAIRLLAVALVVALGLLGNMVCETLRRAHSSQRALEAMMEASPTGMMLVSPQRVVMSTNPAMAQMLGIGTDQIVGRRCDELMSERMCGNRQCAVERVLSSELVQLEEVDVSHSSGAQISCLLSATPVPGLDGSPEAVLQSFHDVSEYQRMQEALAESEHRYRSLLESAPIGILIVQDGILRYANSRAAAAMGYSLEQLIDSPIPTHLAPDVRQTISELHQQRTQRAAAGEDLEPVALMATVMTVDCSRLEVEIAGVMISHDGGPAELLAIRDITAAKQAEWALAAEKERLQVTLRSLSEGVITVDTEGRVILMNRAAEKLLGRAQDEVLNRSLDDVLVLQNAHSSEPLPDPLGRHGLAAGLATAVLVGRDGRERTVAVTSAPVSAPDSRAVGAVVVLRDITAQQRQEQQQRRIETLEAVGLLAGGIAHDFNNLLTGFFGNITLARLALETGGDVQKRLVAAEKSLGRAQELTERLLTFASGGKPVRSRISLAALLQDAIVAAVDGGSERCRLEVAHELWPVEADEGQLRQALVNLVRNADEATGGNGQVTVAADNLRLGEDDMLPLPAGKYVRISVRNHGPAIPHDVLPRIFEPYFTTKPGGTGLGLPVAFSIVRRHDGHLEIESQDECGTKVHVYLPVAEQTTESVPRTLVAPPPAVEGPLRILIMDDEELIRTALSALLEELGHEVSQAADGAAALDMYREAMNAGRCFSLVLMDLTVPGGMGGKEAAGRLRRMDPAARIIVSSGYSTDPIMGAYADYGFDGVIVKPYRLEDLQEVLATVMSSS
jgi:PAS domain S-box-containing protein